MQNRRTTLVISLLLVALLVLAGCGPRAAGATRATPEDSSEIVVDLPAIYIDFDALGNPTVGGMSLSQAGALIGQNLPDIALPAEAIAAMTQYGIQHVQLVNSAKGLDVLVNGLRVPSLAWDPEVLMNLRGLLEKMGMPLGDAGALLPMLGALGTGIVLRFPVNAGEEAVPLLDPAGAEAAARAQEAIKAFEASVGEPPLISFAVQYAKDGTWTLEGENASWLDSLQFDWEQLNLKPASVQGAMNAGIASLNFTTRPEGIQISINDMALPVITWGSGELSNVLNLVKQTGALGDLGPLAGFLNMAESVIPLVQATDFSLTINFPTE